MVVKIPEPRTDQAAHSDWINLVNRTQFQGGGFISLSLTNMNNTERPKIAAGSRLEVNRIFFSVEADDEDIDLSQSPFIGTNYIYAMPEKDADGKDTLRFIMSLWDPQWDAAKGGWYNPSTQSRAVACFYSQSGSYADKIILDSFNAKNNPLIRIEERDRGYLDLRLSNMDNDHIPVILEGSVIELNGRMHRVNSDLTVTAPTIDPAILGQAGTYYLAASDSSGTITFSYIWHNRDNPPRWNAGKKGWYIGNVRTIAKLFIPFSECATGKVILDSFASMSVIRTDLPVVASPEPGSGGQRDFRSALRIINLDWSPSDIFGNGKDPGLYEIYVEPGFYAYDIRGGSTTTGLITVNTPRVVSGEFVINTFGKLTYGVGQAGAGTVETGVTYGGGASFVGPAIAPGAIANVGTTSVTVGGIIYAGQGNLTNLDYNYALGTHGFVNLWRLW